MLQEPQALCYQVLRWKGLQMLHVFLISVAQATAGVSPPLSSYARCQVEGICRARVSITLPDTKDSERMLQLFLLSMQGR